MIGKKPKIIAHINASKKIEKGNSLFAQMLGGKMPKIQIDIKLENEIIIKIGDNDFKVLYTPGHSPGSICLYDKKTKSLISGDTIFSYGSFGRYDFPGGSYNKLKNSIKRISLLDIKNIYPGHDLFIEKNGNKHIKMTLRNIENII
jgi:glyoxylase-like metal-dependent hydrolase (beta-lactamase superfamily II)